MENKKLGIILIVFSLIIGTVMMQFTSELNRQSKEMKCFDNADCFSLEKDLSVTYFGIGIFSFLLSLGFYFLLFNKADERILKRLEEEKNKDFEKQKFDFALKFLNPFERKILKLVKEQEGITQSTLKVKADMSKAKLSYVLSDLEKRELIKRERKGKSLAIYLKV